jgi:hypothetical protein
VPTREVLRRSALAVVTASVVFGLLAGAAASNAFWIAWGLSWIGFPLVGALILWPRPGHAIGWLLMATGACWAILLVGYGLVGEMSVWLELVVVLAGRLGYTTLIATVVLFPTGRAETRGTRLLIGATAVAAGCVVVAGLVDPLPLQISQQPNPLGVPALSGVVGWFNDQGFVIVPLLMLGALTSLVKNIPTSAGRLRTDTTAINWLVDVDEQPVTLNASVDLANWGWQSLVYTATVNNSANVVPVIVGPTGSLSATAVTYLNLSLPNFTRTLGTYTGTLTLNWYAVGAGNNPRLVALQVDVVPDIYRAYLPAIVK